MSFILPADPRPSSCRARSYGWRRALIQIAGAAVCSVALVGATAVQSANAQAPVKIAAFGDSLTAGYGLPDNQGFVPRLQAALAAKYDVLIYPFFLDGAAADLKLLQHDGLHPNASGVDVIVARILPKVEELIAHARAQRPS